MTRFKATEWMMRLEKGEMVPTITLKMLQEMLEEHHKKYLIVPWLEEVVYHPWQRKDIEFFLNINHWLYANHIQEHHIKTCYSILKGMVNVAVE